jgi:hypothetical protein
VRESNSESQWLTLALKQKSDVASPPPKYVPEGVVSEITSDLETALNTERASSRKAAQELCTASTKVRDLEEVIESKNVEIDALCTTTSKTPPPNAAVQVAWSQRIAVGVPLIGELVLETLSTQHSLSTTATMPRNILCSARRRTRTISFAKMMLSSMIK